MIAFRKIETAREKRDIERRETDGERGEGETQIGVREERGEKKEREKRGEREGKERGERERGKREVRERGER